MNFEDWLESKGCMDGYGTDYQDAYDEGFDEGQQSQQAKIDCMQVRLDGANERALSILNHKNVMVDKMQAKIDILKKQLTHLGYTDNGGELMRPPAGKMPDFGIVGMQRDKIDDLQGRIDATLEKCYTGIRKQGGDYYLELVENILKGNKDEN